MDAEQVGADPFDPSAFEPSVTLRAGMTAKQAAAILAAMPPAWRLYGAPDGTVGVGLRRAGRDADTVE